MPHKRPTSTPDHLYYKFRELQRLLAMTDEEYDAHLAANPLKTQGVTLPPLRATKGSIPFGGFGKSAKQEHFLLDPSVVFLQHGSYGAAFKYAIMLQRALSDGLEKNPCLWENELSLPILAHATRCVAPFFGARPTNFVFVANATTGFNTVLKSLHLGKNDIVITLSLGYAAVTKTIDRIIEAAHGGHPVTHRVVDIPTEAIANAEFAATVLQSFEDECIAAAKEQQQQEEGGRGRIVAVFDVVCSGTAVLLPYEQMVAICKRHGIISLVDGAHSAGQVALSLEELGADFFVSNLHKWMMAPKGCAFLWVREDNHDLVYPLVTSHPHNIGLWSEFAWTGTSDMGTFVSAMACVAMFNSIGQEEIFAYNHKLLRDATDLLVSMWGGGDTGIVLLRGHTDHSRNMCIVQLPPSGSGKADTEESAYELHKILERKYNIEALIKHHEGTLSVRLSAQMYNFIEEYELLGRAVLEERRGM